MSIDRIVSARELRTLIPLSASQIWRLEKSGDFPKRILVGRRRVGWRSTDISNWISERTNEAKREGAIHE